MAAVGNAHRLRLLFLLRYSALTGLFPALFVVLALDVNPGLLKGLLVLDTPGQLVNATWLSVLPGALVLVTLRVVQINAPDRRPSRASTGFMGRCLRRGRLPGRRALTAPGRARGAARAGGPPGSRRWPSR
jgi:hypothetical protein